MLVLSGLPAKKNALFEISMPSHGTTAYVVKWLSLWDQLYVNIPYRPMDPFWSSEGTNHLLRLVLEPNTMLRSSLDTPIILSQYDWISTRWAPTSYKWSYNACKWPL